MLGWGNIVFKYWAGFTLDAPGAVSLHESVGKILSETPVRVTRSHVDVEY